MDNKESTQNDLLKLQDDDLSESLGILDINAMNLEGSLWLCESFVHPNQNKNNDDHKKCLNDEECSIASTKTNPSKKTIDTRTFTRPKKRFFRPSITDVEHFSVNENDTSTPKHSSVQAIKEESSVTTNCTPQPLHFNLSESTADNFLMNTCDYLDNISPPSLVNSLYSSTFTMQDNERDVALLQDQEAPLFQSITDNSLDAHGIESLNNTIIAQFRDDSNTKKNESKIKERKNHSLNPDEQSFNGTFLVDQDKNSTYQKQTDLSTFNGTYRKTPMRNATFTKYRNQNTSNDTLNATYNIYQNDDLEQSIENDMNSSNKNVSDELNLLCSKFKEVAITSPQCKALNETFVATNLNQSRNKLETNGSRVLNQDNSSSTITSDTKRMSIGSSDSLDMASSLSSSSKGSNKMLNMADIDAIVLMQEKSLIQAMSTPKPNTAVNNLNIETCLSPIVSYPTGNLSDPEVLCSRANFIKPEIKHRISKTPDNHFQKRKSYYTAQVPKDETFKKPLQSFNNNLKSPTPSSLAGKSQNKPSSLMRPPSVSSNLQNIGRKLGGSYTSLRPISAPQITHPKKPIGPLRAPMGTSNLQSVGTKFGKSYTSLRPASGPPLPVVSTTSTALSTNTKNHVPDNNERASAVTTNSTDHVPLRPKSSQASSGLPRPSKIARPVSRIAVLQRNVNK